MTALLEVDNLVKHFPVTGEFGAWHILRHKAQVHAVDDVSLTIAEGETVGLVGESGCGKSTLARLLARLLDPTSGTIRFEGKDIGSVAARRFSRRPERAEIQMVFQDPTDSLNPRFTAFDAIADPLRRLKSPAHAAIVTLVENIARLCGLSHELLGRFPHQLSVGQKARVGIARAVVVEPRLLILDEPTSALDVSVQVIILKLLDELKNRLGLSYLFVTHDLNIVRLFCQRVLVMYSGKIVESGLTSQVFAGPIHPYTEALISAIPTFQSDQRQFRIVLPGEPVSPIDPNPDVCRFYGRCLKGAGRCTQEMPILSAHGHGRFAACHFPA